MLREVLILLSCGSVAYAWLCAVAAPLVRAVRSIAEAPTRASWIALALAIGAAVMWMAIVAAAILLLMMLEPRAGLAFAGSQLVTPGAAGGAAAWLLHGVATRRVPRVGDEFEAATAAAVLEFYGSMVLRSDSVRTRTPEPRTLEPRTLEL